MSCAVRGMAGPRLKRRRRAPTSFATTHLFDTDTPRNSPACQTPGDPEITLSSHLATRNTNTLTANILNSRNRERRTARDTKSQRLSNKS